MAIVNPSITNFSGWNLEVRRNRRQPTPGSGGVRFFQRGAVRYLPERDAADPLAGIGMERVGSPTVSPTVDRRSSRSVLQMESDLLRRNGRSGTVDGGERLDDVDRNILAIPNVIPAGDMNSDCALVKLMWALGQGGDVRSIMRTDLAGEISVPDTR